MNVFKGLPLFSKIAISFPDKKKAVHSSIFKITV